MSCFGMGSVAYHVKWSFGLFQGVTLVLISPTSHVDMFYTHSQSFMHCHTSVVTFVASVSFVSQLERYVALLSH